VRHGKIADCLRLDHHFSVGTSAFERSVFGTQLARAEMYYQVRTPGPRAEVTARPRTMREYMPPADPNEFLMVEYGYVSRRLARMPVRLREALSRWHGDSGAEWSNHKRGRCVALFPLTRSGTELVAMERRQASAAALELSDAERLRNAVLLDDVQNGRDSIRRRLITMATREAHALYTAAQTAWEETK
jgi:hypothetical protein